MAGIQRRLFRRLGRRRNRLEYLLPNASLAPTGKAIVDRLVGPYSFGQSCPAAANLQNMHDPAQNRRSSLRSGPGWFVGKMRLDLRPLLVIEPNQMRFHRLAPNRLTNLLNQNMLNQVLTQGRLMLNICFVIRPIRARRWGRCRSWRTACSKPLRAPNTALICTPSDAGGAFRPGGPGATLYF